MDYIANLYDLDFTLPTLEGVKIERVLTPDCDEVVRFVSENFNNAWASEIKASLYKSNPTCFIAIKNKEVIGFACYDATCKGFFGPTGVKETERSKGIGKSLLLKTLRAMKEEGYAYAIIGSVSLNRAGFYESQVKAKSLNNEKSVYDRMIKY